MKYSHTPVLYNHYHTAQIVNRQILDIFYQYSSNDFIFIEDTWAFRFLPQISELLQSNPNKHAVIYSGFDPTKIEDIQEFCGLDQHPAGYTLIGNTKDKTFNFSYWLEFARCHLDKYDVGRPINNISKLFLSLNRKPHRHRIEFVKMLYDNNLNDHGFISLSKDGGQPGANFLGLPVPISLDFENFVDDCTDATNSFDSYIFLVDSKFWQQSFINVVTETTLGEKIFISEKILKPILACQPFIAIGPNYLGSIFDEWGIDVLQDILNINYHDIGDLSLLENRQKYFSSIGETLTCLKNENLNLLYKSLLPRLIENKKALINAMENNHKYMINLAKQF